MARTNQECIVQEMELLRAELSADERDVQPAVNAATLRMDAVRPFAEEPMLGNEPIVRWDLAGLPRLMIISSPRSATHMQRSPIVLFEPSQAR